MIIVMKQNAPLTAVENLETELNNRGFKVSRSQGESKVVLGLIGDTFKLDERDFLGNEWVEKVMRVQEPYKRASRSFHPQNSIIDVSGVKVGGKKLVVMAGPCSIETPEQIHTVAQAVKNSGASLLRGGAFKPRTSPYSFQGLREKGLDMLIEAAKDVQLPVVTELMSADKIGTFLEKKVDLIQIGARNMQNFDLLRAVGRLNVPVLLKRGLSATIDEWLMSAEYIMSEGNQNVILCERGIRTFEKATRNTLDLSAVTVVKRRSHLPVIVDPSHATGHRWMVEDMAMAAIAAGADGIMCEVHNDPEHAWCDGAESITPETFDHLMGRLRQLAPIVGREL
ncbi:3-deoxy-7-phosphoheptulonate synthase [Allisonella histaminiformans]|jgi:3-deoxy-7-phosphoheptulonate synthase|uniref:3-deoxy-D-arabinoheptulosonate-7-phosphate synthase n=2 Tax=Allisonella histaminiformans TaxID=209880 RepID=A0A1G5UYK0_9FIRM|nr:3-deoxy-7-phosphoheptulonate synthase [Allisonella histaminiformans]PWL47191.1 MAG: 3-deoxy-7-phosphoheptulonate synthase [Veillonellaceae bacterium]MCI6003858.1 3-deoxy-7-phosphoheptulonate synthase [Allisonella histaminiformans]MDD6870231.1 3-deoxy-7-phosphoheptulonate synthase [Allisonella histaminiformans]MDY3957890.1 3-deoxy-7-phosphoheptulonate synthase [Allisonella histaminiformans]SDA38428.1 3-deoxy-D-arabinoheptulosonate-7-phosphate synthase [Allisonella histaminiformans]